MSLGNVQEHELLTLSRAGAAKTDEMISVSAGGRVPEGGCINLDSLLQEQNCTVAC